ncbi:MAG TPA: hypothetical protein VF257_17665 [Solirubrobacteraceae bacterium]
MHLVTDRGPDDPACADLVRRLATALPGAIVQLTVVAPCDTLAAGCCVAELAVEDATAERLVAHDVTPGPGDPGPWPDGAGEQLCVGRSATGVLIVGPNRGWGWSFAVDALRGLCCMDIVPRDVDDRLPLALRHARKRHPHAVTGTVSRAAVPAPPERAVAYIDEAGTLKTTLAALPADVGSRVLVEIGDVRAPALVSDGSVAVPDGELALAPGPAGGYLQLLQRGGSAAERFAEPATGTPIRVMPAA